MVDHGPIPKRSDQRRRRNKPPEDSGTKTTKAEVTGEVYGPALAAGGKHCAAAQRFYESLRRSGQAQFYQASDWNYAADVVCTAIDAYTKRPSAAMLTALTDAMTPLLVTEGDRRRARLELALPGAKQEDKVPDAADINEARRRIRACQ